MESFLYFSLPPRLSRSFKSSHSTYHTFHLIPFHYSLVTTTASPCLPNTLPTLTPCPWLCPQRDLNGLPTASTQCRLPSATTLSALHQEFPHTATVASLPPRPATSGVAPAALATMTALLAPPAVSIFRNTCRTALLAPSTPFRWIAAWLSKRKRESALFRQDRSRKRAALAGGASLDLAQPGGIFCNAEECFR